MRRFLLCAGFFLLACAGALAFAALHIDDVVPDAAAESAPFLFGRLPRIGAWFAAGGCLGLGVWCLLASAGRVGRFHGLGQDAEEERMAGDPRFWSDLPPS